MPITGYTRLEGDVGRCPTPLQGETPPAPADASAARLAGTCSGCRDWQEHGPFGMAVCRRWGLQPRDAKRCHAWMPQEVVRQ